MFSSPLYQQQVTETTTSKFSNYDNIVFVCVFHWLFHECDYPFEKLTVAQIIRNGKKFREPKIFVMFTRVCLWSLSRVRWYHSTPSRTVCSKYSLTLSSHLWLHFSNVFLNFYRRFRFPHACYLHLSFSSSSIWTPYWYLVNSTTMKFLTM